MAKRECYPPKNYITLSDSTANIKLQAHLDVTAKRMLKCITISDDCMDLKLISKWGF